MQFAEQAATVNIVNQLVDPSDVIVYAGDTKSYVTINTSSYQSVSWSLQGNGQQLVWINADSTQNSESATIAVQSLSGLYEAHKAGR